MIKQYYFSSNTFWILYVNPVTSYSLLSKSNIELMKYHVDSLLSQLQPEDLETSCGISIAIDVIFHMKRNEKIYVWNHCVYTKQYVSSNNSALYYNEY